MIRMRRFISIAIIAALLLTMSVVPAAAKTHAAGQTVETVLFYIENAKGEQILVSHVPVSQMVSDLKAGKISSQNHNYSLLDRYVTTVHQEAKGFTVGEFISYAQSFSSVDLLKNLKMTFEGNDAVSFWEIDQAGFDSGDTYTYNDLYGVARYNFPLLYEYWDYRAQDYADPAGKMSRNETIDYIFKNGERENVLLSVESFSQRYMATDGKYGTGDYSMENYWESKGKMDDSRAIRLLIPMTEQELRNATASASDSRYWNSNILLSMKNAPAVSSLGTVKAPAATVTEDDTNYYITFRCETAGATILYNHNFDSPSYTPTSQYTGSSVAVPKTMFPDGTISMTCRAIKDGYTDAGVVTLRLKATGTEEVWKNPYKDVASGAWYYDNVKYVCKNGLFDATGEGTFSPEAPMTRAMLATALYRMAGKPGTAGIASTPFTDVSSSANYADAVAWAYSAGIVNGVSDKSFAPGASITREQITAMFHRYAEKIAKADMSVSRDLSGYSDHGAVAAYAQNTMKWCVAAGLINGTSATTLSPKGTATRAQVAAMVQRLKGYTN